jgi:adenosylhomocysteine nucleosidase
MSDISTRSMRVGVITGLQKEIACLRPDQRQDGLQLWCEAAAGQPERAAETARTMVAEGAAALISFGVAGGLDPSLGPGLIVIADKVVDLEGRSFPCHGPWVDALLRLDGGFDSGAILGSDQPILTPQHKTHLFRRSQALAVDMESHAVAEVAADTNVPFLTIRAIGDPAGRAIPTSALAGLGPDGNIRALPVIWNLLRRPKDIPNIWRLASDTNKALKALRALSALDLHSVLAQ